MLEVLPSCFGENGMGAPAAQGRSKTTQNLINCLYEVELRGASRLVSVTWCKSLLGQGLIVHVIPRGSFHDCPCVNVDMKPWCFWKKQGRKALDAGGGREVEVFWDFNSAKYASGPEPQEKYYVALVLERETVLLVGDMKDEAYKRTGARAASIEPTLVSRREHVFGKRYYTTTAQFGDKRHEIVIECHTGGPKEPRLYLRVDKKVVLQVKHLTWKFRGNQTIHVDGLAVEVFWDVHNWLFNPTIGHAVFMFQTCPSNDGDHKHRQGLVYWPSSSSIGVEKKLQKSSCNSSSTSAFVLRWASDSSVEEGEGRSSQAGFSLLVYAWKSD